MIEKKIHLLLTCNILVIDSKFPTKDSLNNIRDETGSFGRVLNAFHHTAKTHQPIN
jgi:hypothetical protein